MMLGSHLVSGTLHRGLYLVMSKTSRIGDTKYHFRCSSPSTQEVSHALHTKSTHMCVFEYA